jgi:hypothetical protein
LVGFLFASGAVFLLASIFYLLYRSTWGDYLDERGTLGELLDAEDLAIGAFGSAFILAGVAGVLFIIWHYQAYRSIESLAPTGTRWSPGWAVGGWFIPFANLVIPKLVMNEVERVSDPMSEPAPVGTRWMHAPLGALGSLWWASWVSGIVVWWVASVMDESADFYSDSIVGTSLYVFAIASVLLAASGALAASYVIMIRRRLDFSRSLPRN